MQEPGETPCDCKIGRQQVRYDISDLDERIVDHHQNRGTSLRDLASVVNTRILDSAITSVEADVAGDPRSVYEALTDEDVGPERRADVRDQLAFVGIDVDDLQRDFVSHQTVKKHLSDCLGFDTSRPTIQSVEEAKAKIEWSRGRTRTVTENVVDQLRRGDLVAIGAPEITQTISITCTECNRSYRLDEFLDTRQCECESVGPDTRRDTDG